MLVERYWDGIASRRQYPYWVWANLAALAVSAGPLVGAGVASRDFGGCDRCGRCGRRPVVVLDSLAAASIIV